MGLQRSPGPGHSRRQLRRLTGQGDKLRAEHDELEARIADYRDILARDERQFGLIKEDLAELISRYGDERRSVISEPVGELDMEDLIEDEGVVTITASGYIKRLPSETYRVQKRGGKGVTGGKLKDDDEVTQMFLANMHQYLLVFTTVVVCTGSRCTTCRRVRVPAVAVR